MGCPNNDNVLGVLQLVYAQTVFSATDTIPTSQNRQSSDFGYYFQNRATAPPTPSYPTNTHTQKPILTCDQPGHPSCHSIDPVLIRPLPSWISTHGTSWNGRL